MPQPGRPTRMNEVIGQRPLRGPDGEPTGETEPITVADRILDALRSGQYVETACAMATVHKDTFYGWLNTGAEAHKLLAAGAITRRKLTAQQVRCMEFSDAVDEAQRMSEAQDVTRLAQLAGGGIPIVTTTEKVDATGAVVERTTRTTATLPDARVLTWRLERRFPTRWGRRTEVSGPDGGPVQVDHGVDALLALVERLEDQDIDPTAVLSDSPEA